VQKRQIKLNQVTEFFCYDYILAHTQMCQMQGWGQPGKLVFVHATQRALNQLKLAKTQFKPTGNQKCSLR